MGKEIQLIPKPFKANRDGSPKRGKAIFINGLTREEVYRQIIENTKSF